MMLTTKDPHDRIIWSADVSDYETLCRELKKMDGLLRYIKLDQAFMYDNMAEFSNIVRKIKEVFGILTFFDSKATEIPTKLRLIAMNIIKNIPELWMLNCMAGGASNRNFTNSQYGAGLDGLRQFADACTSGNVLSCGVTVLTSKTPRTVSMEYGGNTPDEQVGRYVKWLRAAGFTDVVCSPLEAAILRQNSAFDGINFNCPGIRPSGGDVGDQARVDTPTSAIEAGIDRLVIGRPITQGKYSSPADNLKAIADEVEEAMAA